MLRYTSAYVPIQNNVSVFGDLGALPWLAEMPALVCAGLESSTCLNLDSNSQRMLVYALGATGDRSVNSYADSVRMLTYARAYASMEYEPGLRVMTVAWSMATVARGTTTVASVAEKPWDYTG